MAHTYLMLHYMPEWGLWLTEEQVLMDSMMFFDFWAWLSLCWEDRPKLSLDYSDSIEASFNSAVFICLELQFPEIFIGQILSSSTHFW